MDPPQPPPLLQLHFRIFQILEHLHWPKLRQVRMEVSGVLGEGGEARTRESHCAEPCSYAESVLVAVLVQQLTSNHGGPTPGHVQYLGTPQLNIPSGLRHDFLLGVLDLVSSLSQNVLKL